MSISQLYESGTQKNNEAHFAAMTNITMVDGQVNEKEETILRKWICNKILDYKLRDYAA